MVEPRHFIYYSAFLSFWGDRMWSFAVGLYLVQITPGSLQLSAIYGLVLSFSAIVFSPIVGEWIDKNGRLKVVRILLLLQNTLVILCALVILLYIKEVSSNHHVLLLFKSLIIIAGSSANIAGQGQKIAIGKDWVVVISKGSKDLLSTTNAMVRRIDLTVALLAPVAVGLLMSLVSSMAGIIFICSWNVVSMTGEYLLLLKVYRQVPELATKKTLNDNGDLVVSSEEKDQKSSNRDENYEVIGSL